MVQNSKHNIETKSFSLQESNADLPSEYWQIQKLVKYLKVCIVPMGISSGCLEEERSPCGHILLLLFVFLAGL